MNIALISRIARTDEELERIFDVSSRSYTRHFDAGAFPDQYTPHSVHFYALDEHGIVVGTIRLVTDSDEGLPMERYIDVSGLKAEILEGGGKYVEVSGFATEPPERMLRRPGFLLIETIYKYSRRNGITDFLAAVNPDHILFYERLGVRQIGNRFYYNGLSRDGYPIHIPLDGFMEPFRSRFGRPNESIIID